MSEIVEPKVAFYLRIKANCIKQTFAIIKSLVYNVTMLVTSAGITFVNIDRFQSSGHEIFLASEKIAEQGDIFYVHTPETGPATPIILVFDATILYQNLKRVNRNDFFEMWYHFDGAPVLSMRIKGEPGVSYIQIHSKDAPIYHCDVKGKTPNVIVNSKVFSDICTACHNVKCCKLKIEGYANSAVFRGINTNKISLYDHPVGTTNPWCEKVIEANIISQVFKPLNKLSVISSKGDLSLYFDKGQVIISSQIDRYGTYLITIPKAEETSTK